MSGWKDSYPDALPVGHISRVGVPDGAGGTEYFDVTPGEPLVFPSRVQAQIEASADPSAQIVSIEGTCHCGGATQNEANASMFGWTLWTWEDTDDDGEADAGDTGNAEDWRNTLSQGGAADETAEFEFGHDSLVGGEHTPAYPGPATFADAVADFPNLSPAGIVDAVGWLASHSYEIHAPDPDWLAGVQVEAAGHWGRDANWPASGVPTVATLHLDWEHTDSGVSAEWASDFEAQVRIYHGAFSDDLETAVGQGVQVGTFTVTVGDTGTESFALDSAALAECGVLGYDGPSVAVLPVLSSPPDAPVATGENAVYFTAALYDVWMDVPATADWAGPGLAQDASVVGWEAPGGGAQAVGSDEGTPGELLPSGASIELITDWEAGARGHFLLLEARRVDGAAWTNLHEDAGSGEKTPGATRSWDPLDAGGLGVTPSGGVDGIEATDVVYVRFNRKPGSIVPR